MVMQGLVLRWEGGSYVRVACLGKEVMEVEFTTVGAYNLRHLAASEIAERALIGAVMLNGIATFESVGGIVSAKDFSNGELASVYGVLEDMHANKQPLDDVLLVAARLKALGVLESMGGPIGIAKAVEYAMPHHAVYYAIEIRKYARIRMARDAAIAILAECERDDCRLNNVSEIAAKRLLRLTSVSELMETIKGA
jgi:replicative DNA helicase